ncbi:DNA mismatch repair protein MutS [Thermoproteota archaeon]
MPLKDQSDTKPIMSERQIPAASMLSEIIIETRNKPQSYTPDTPMLRQYKEIKSKHTDAILFFRLGDFYEMFLDDAKTASKELKLTLTGRGKDENRIPMCGIPYHASDSYIAKLVSRGYKVAVCEQTEDPSQAKGLTKREVVKIITPGTVQDSTTLQEKDNNYICAVYPTPGQDPGQESFGLSYADISTGEFRICAVMSNAELMTLLDKIQTKEILLPYNCTLSFNQNILINRCNFIDPAQAKEALIKHFNVSSLSGFGFKQSLPSEDHSRSEDLTQALPAAWQILDYLIKTQKHAIPQITSLLPLKITDFLIMDHATIRNLELTESIFNEKSSTLFATLDYTKTSMGGRRLKHLLKQPFINVTTINNRLDAVEALKTDLLSREEIRDILNQVYDLERLVSRIVSENNNPRDCIALKQSLSALSDTHSVLCHVSQSPGPNESHTNRLNRVSADSGNLLLEYTNFFKDFSHESSVFSKLIQLIDHALIDQPPVSIKDGGFIKKGFSEQLDQLILSFKSIRDWIASLEAVEREQSNIKSLKVGFNKVFGYYLTIPNSYKDKIPDHYIRKQTLTNAERYITPELKEKENILLHGEDRQHELEIQLYKELVSEIRAHIPELQKLAQITADLDCLQALSTAAQRNNYTRPVFAADHDLVLDVSESRHPVLEIKSDIHFIPNDIHMNQDENRFILITGPNMAGKSTFMRQIALTTVMAQIGSFVPAASARLSIVDKLFTRIGALDNLYAGMSTFMVEMLETASILNNATSQSLVLLDEIGRGTSTFDGMSIACAVSEYIHEHIQARTLFATHYHELTTLEKTLNGFSNYNMLITEADNTIIFNHKFTPGPADKSYGVHVAKMAGLPKAVIEKADQLLAGFENEGIHYLKNQNKPEQLSLF